MSSASSDIESLKARLKATWMAGDFGLIARSYEGGAAEFVRRLGLAPGARVLAWPAGRATSPCRRRAPGPT